MSCGGTRSFNGDTNPFGNLRGPYRCTPSGCRFSLTAETDLIRRGFEFGEIDELRGIFGSNSLQQSVIRPSVPRDVSLDVDRVLSPEEQDRVSDIEARINDIREQISVVTGRGGDTTILERALSLNQADLTSLTRETITLQGLDIILDATNQEISDNPLNCYTDVQYHVALTMMSQESAIEFQQNGLTAASGQVDINTLRSEVRSDRSITLASTGDVFGSRYTAGSSAAFGPDNRETAADTNNYYNIDSLVVKNLMEPSASNPLVSTMLSMKMQIAEPHGLKLHEDIRDTAIKLGYVDINPGRVLYRVDIYFSGYNQDTGEWVEQIGLSTGANATNIISSVMGISAIEAEVTSSGTLYAVDLVPAGHHAYRPEDFILSAGAFNTGATFRDFLRYFSTSLADAKFERTQGQLLRNYEFYAPQILLDSPFDASAFFEQNKFIFQSRDTDSVVTSGRDVDIMTILRGAIANTTVAHELFIADQNNDDFTQPRVHFGLRFNSLYGDTNGAITVDPRLNDYKEITHQYFIEPFVTFKHGPVTLENLDTYVDPQSQLARIREIIRFGMLRRIYNYIYTAENTEVIDFDIKLKAFYYHTLNTSDNTPAAGRQGFNSTASDAITANAGRQDLFRVLAGNAGSPENVDATMRRLFGDVGNSISTGSGTTNRTGADRLGGGFNETGDSQYYGSVVSPPDGRRGDYETYMDDYLSLDLLKLNGMQVRGDPVWLLSPYANKDIDGLQQITASEGVAERTPSSATRVRPRQGQIIFLKIKAPNQDDHMNPGRDTASSYPNIIGGFYQLTDVTSTFSGGKFTQSLEGIKLNHLNYAEGLFNTGAEGTPAGATGSDQLEPTFDIEGISDLLDGL